MLTLIELNLLIWFQTADNSFSDSWFCYDLISLRGLLISFHWAFSRSSTWFRFNGLLINLLQENWTIDRKLIDWLKKLPKQVWLENDCITAHIQNLGFVWKVERFVFWVTFVKHEAKRFQKPKLRFMREPLAVISFLLSFFKVDFVKRTSFDKLIIWKILHLYFARTFDNLISADFNAIVSVAVNWSLPRRTFLGRLSSRLLNWLFEAEEVSSPENVRDFHFRFLWI